MVLVFGMEGVGYSSWRALTLVDSHPHPLPGRRRVEGRTVSAAAAAPGTEGLLHSNWWDWRRVVSRVVVVEEEHNNWEGMSHSSAAGPAIFVGVESIHLLPVSAAAAAAGC